VDAQARIADAIRSLDASLAPFGVDLVDASGADPAAAVQTRWMLPDASGADPAAAESFYLDLFGNSSNALFTKKRSLGTILNDD
jgi:hypothetical protein